MTHRPIPDDFHPSFTDDARRGLLSYRAKLIIGEGPDRREIHVETGLRYGVPTKTRAQAQAQLRELAWSIQEHCRCGTASAIHHHTKARRQGAPVSKPDIPPDIEAQLNAPGNVQA